MVLFGHSCINFLNSNDMKSILFLMIACTSGFSLNAQTTSSIAGTYTNKWESNSGEALEYSLTLDADGSFIFQSNRLFDSVESEKTLTAKGSWKLQNQILVLFTDPNDFNNNELSLHLNNTKARFVNISPRNTNFSLVKPSLKFYKSEVFYAKDMELLKEETSVTKTD